MCKAFGVDRAIGIHISCRGLVTGFGGLGFKVYAVSDV